MIIDIEKFYLSAMYIWLFYERKKNILLNWTSPVNSGNVD